MRMLLLGVAITICALCIGQTSPVANGTIRRIKSGLLSANPDTRASSLAETFELGSAIDQVQEELENLLDDHDYQVQALAAEALGFGELIKEDTLPILIGLLKSPNSDVRASAAFALSKTPLNSKELEDSLIRAAMDLDQQVRCGAMNAIAAHEYMGPEVDACVSVNIRSSDPYLKYQTLRALSKIQTSLPMATKVLVEQYNNGSSQTRREVVDALAQFRKVLPPAISVAKSAIASSDAATRAAACSLVANIKPVEPDLAERLADNLVHNDQSVRRAAMAAMTNLGLEVASTLPKVTRLIIESDVEVVTEPQLYVSSLCLKMFKESSTCNNATLELLEKSLKESLAVAQRDEVKQQSLSRSSSVPYGDIRTALNLIQSEAQSRFFARVPALIKSQPVLASLCIIMLLGWLLSLTVFALNPRVLLQIPDEFSALNFDGAPNLLRVVASLPGAILGYGPLKYSKRVLDSWLTHEASGILNQLMVTGLVAARLNYVDLPVRVGDDEKYIDATFFHSEFEKDRVTINVVGSGGTGKTTLAAQMMMAALEEEPAYRICSRYKLIPILVESDFSEDTVDPEKTLISLVGTKLAWLLQRETRPSDRLVNALLAKGRILLVVDGVTELDTNARGFFVGSDVRLKAHYIVYTSRRALEECAPSLQIGMTLLHGPRLASFVDEYLREVNVRKLYSDEEFFEAMSKLSRLVRSRPITAMLAQLYSEFLVASVSEVVKGDVLDIPDLMAKYFVVTWNKVGVEGISVEEAFRACCWLAWEFVADNYYVSDISRSNCSKAASHYGGAEGLAFRRIVEAIVLETGLVEIRGVLQDRLHTENDPMWEHFAARHLVLMNGESDDLWHVSLQRMRQRKSQGDGLGFFCALEDSIQSAGVCGEIVVPEFVYHEVSLLIEGAPT